MKLADAPADVLADLALVRTPYRADLPQRVPADGGLWFSRADHDENEGDACAMCGMYGKGDPIQHDHCHYTGLSRGLLCRECNRGEARIDAPRFDWWALHAPDLVGVRTLHGPEGLLNGFAHDELLTAPMADLLSDPRARYISGHQFHLWNEARWRGLTNRGAA